MYSTKKTKIQCSHLQVILQNWNEVKQVPLDEHKVKQVPLDIKGHKMLFYAMPYYCCKEAKYKLDSKEQNDAGNATRINVYFIRFEMPDFFSIWIYCGWEFYVM